MTDVTLLQEYGTYEEELMGHSDAVSAHAGGGQGSATALTSKWNTVTTCASDGDSVKLIISKKGYWQSVFNNTSHSLAVFPSSGEKINGIANYQISVSAGLSAWFSCTSDGQWIGLVIDPSGQVISATYVLSSTQLKNLFSSPVQVLPAPGSGYAIEIISGSHKYNKGSNGYTGGGQLQIITDTVTANSYQLRGVNNYGSSSFFERLISQSISGNMKENAAIMLTCDTQNYANGDGDVDVYFTYRIVKL